MAVQRQHWGSRFGFVLAAAGSAVGLGNIWRFPYITGENGGGLFVLIYLACIALVGLPILIGEIMLGRMTQTSVVGAFRTLNGGAFRAIGYLGVAGAFLILSFYSVVAGWAMHYVYLSVTGQLSGRSAEEIGSTFGAVAGSAPLSLFWHGVVMAVTVGVVLGGVQKGLERWSKILMPALLLMLLALLAKAFTMSGFGPGFDFVFGLHAEDLTSSGVLEALGHSFFTLSLGMGAMLTYGSYLDRDRDIPANALIIAGLDTLIALLACLVLFPIIFTAGQAPAQGPGLVFANIPIAFSTMPGSALLGTVFFVLLVFAAVTSTMSLLEVAATYFIDEHGTSRTKATLGTGLAITLMGIPAALANGANPWLSGENFFGKNWFDFVADTTSNVFLPIGGFGIALFVGWRLKDADRRAQFDAAGWRGRLYRGWLEVIRIVVPIAVLVVFLRKMEWL